MPKSRDTRKALRDHENLIDDQIEMAWARLLARDNFDFEHRPVDLMRPSRESGGTRGQPLSSAVAATFPGGDWLVGGLQPSLAREARAI